MKITKRFDEDILLCQTTVRTKYRVLVLPFENYFVWTTVFIMMMAEWSRPGIVGKDMNLPLNIRYGLTRFQHIHVFSKQTMNMKSGATVITSIEAIFS